MEQTEQTNTIAAEQLTGSVLVVDDEAGIRNVVSTFLSHNGLTVETASNGNQALELIESMAFDVVISDIMMPGIDGLALAERLRDEHPDVMVILMTGYASMNTAVEAIKRGVFDYILKPFQNMQILLQAVSRGLERKRLLVERNQLVDDLRRTNEELAYHRGLLEDRVAEIDSELSRRVKRLSLLYDISRTLTSITRIDELLPLVMDSVCSVIHGSAGILWLANDDRKSVRREVVVGFDDESSVPATLPVKDGAIGESARWGRARIIQRKVECYDPALRNLFNSTEAGAVVVVPLRFEERQFFGTIMVFAPPDHTVHDEDVSLLGAIADQASVSIKNAELFVDQQRLFRETIEALATAIDSRDNYTGGHSEMVTEYSLRIAEQLGFDEERLETIRVAGLLHDVGKIGISDTILNKPGRLTEDEMEIIKGHPVLGKVILSSIKALKPVTRIVYHHHERFDGSGYPDGIAGDAIPLESRIIQVADIFDALTSNRIYRKAMPLEKAISIISEGLGTVSDPEVGRVFLAMVENGTLDGLIGS